MLFHDVESYPHSVGVFFEEIKGGHKIIRSGSAGLGIFTRSEKDNEENTTNLMKKKETIENKRKQTQINQKKKDTSIEAKRSGG